MPGQGAGGERDCGAAAAATAVTALPPWSAGDSAADARADDVASCVGAGTDDVVGPDAAAASSPCRRGDGSMLGVAVCPPP